MPVVEIKSLKKLSDTELDEFFALECLGLKREKKYPKYCDSYGRDYVVKQVWKKLNGNS